MIGRHGTRNYGKQGEVKRKKNTKKAEEKSIDIKLQFRFKLKLQENGHNTGGLRICFTCFMM